MRNYDVIVVGGGAAGLMAAGVAASEGCHVLLCEKMEKPARKVRITGKGRCNLTNMRTESEFLSKVRASSEFFRMAFRSFSNSDTVQFFESIGVPLTVERGERVFPTSGRAWDIAEALVEWCKGKGVEIECNTKITEILTSVGAKTTQTLNRNIQGKDKVVGVITKNKSGRVEQIFSSKVIISTGGVSYPATGSTGDGYTFAYELGHHIEPVRPSLVPLESFSDFIPDLKGLALKNVSAKLLVDGHVECEEFGELEFTRFGVSGPIVLRFSRKTVDALIEGHKVSLVIDLKPALSREKILNRMEREIAALQPGATLRDLVRKLLPKELSLVVLKLSGLQGNPKISLLKPKDKMRITEILKNFEVSIDDYRPFEEAIVTAGGVSVEDVYAETMESRKVSGLYFAGEVLDIDADTGGYNLQIAFSTGCLAGLSAAKRK